jgi:CHAD domain-containing protein
MGALAKDCLAVDLIRQVIAEHTRHLLVSDVGIRRGLPDSIHQMRVAARRLRSTLQSFSGLLDSEQSERLRGELAWIARELGAVRDLEVLLERLVEQADQLPDGTDAEVASNVVRTELERRLKAAQSSALAALRSDRHSDLIEDLIAAIEVKTPLDIEEAISLPRGNIFHKDLSMPFREDGTPESWGVETDDPRIFICGAGAVRGGGVSGIPGHNAAMAILSNN